MIRALRSYLGDLDWRFRKNGKAAAAWRKQGERVQGALEQQMLEELRRDGLTRTSLDALLGDGQLFAELEQEVGRLLAVQKDAIDQARVKAGEKTSKKSYLYEPLGPDPVFDPLSVYGRISLAPAILRVVNQYFGMFTELRYLGLWLNLPTDAPAQRSQLWHRDREDRKILKAFLYLSDVTPGSGALIYAPGTHKDGPVRAEPYAFKEKGHGNWRSEDEHMAAVVPPERWITCTAPKGTLVLADTAGYHRGGLAREGDRLLLTFMFVSGSAESGPRLPRKNEEIPARTAPPAEAWALGLAV